MQTIAMPTRLLTCEYSYLMMVDGLLFFSVGFFKSCKDFQHSATSRHVSQVFNWSWGCTFMAHSAWSSAATEPLAGRARPCHGAPLCAPRRMCQRAWWAPSRVWCSQQGFHKNGIVGNRNVMLRLSGRPSCIASRPCALLAWVGAGLLVGAGLFEKFYLNQIKS
jgi:hypothetical protein